MSKAKVNEHIEVLSSSQELSERIAAALQRRIAQEFAAPVTVGPKQTKKLKKGGSK